jgi:hypothetical protein
MTRREGIGGRFLLVIVGLVCLGLAGGSADAVADNAADFAGTVLKVDPAYNKLTVVKEGGGTRFTFVVDDKTRFEGATFKSLKKGDAVVVRYVMNGSAYLAQRVSKK